MTDEELIAKLRSGVQDEDYVLGDDPAIMAAEDVMKDASDRIEALVRMVQEARDQAFREAAKAAGDAAVEVLLRHYPYANVLTQQTKRQSVAVPVLRLIGTPHPMVAGNDG